MLLTFQIFILAVAFGGIQVLADTVGGVRVDGSLLGFAAALFGFVTISRLGPVATQDNACSRLWVSASDPLEMRQRKLTKWHFVGWSR